jgi:hypothetical protein
MFRPDASLPTETPDFSIWEGLLNRTYPWYLKRPRLVNMQTPRPVRINRSPISVRNRSSWRRLEQLAGLSFTTRGPTSLRPTSHKRQRQTKHISGVLALRPPVPMHSGTGMVLLLGVASQREAVPPSRVTRHIIPSPATKTLNTITHTLSDGHTSPPTRRASASAGTGAGKCRLPRGVVSRSPRLPT